ncbi:MAG: hypothetical protein ABIR66_12535, partial [Saprospiraceae bacterium]
MTVPKGVFQEYGFPESCDPRRFGSGLIHDTYYFTHSDQAFLIQRLNHDIFKDLDGMMSNIEKVQRFISTKYPE